MVDIFNIGADITAGGGEESLLWGHASPGNLIRGYYILRQIFDHLLDYKWGKCLYLWEAVEVLVHICT